MPGGVIVEALGIKKAAECGIIGLEAFATAMAHKERNFEVGEVLAANYTNMDGESLVLSISRELELPQAQLNGIQISLDHYSV